MAKVKTEARGSVWAKMKGYAGGGETQDDEQDDQAAEQQPMVTPGAGMRELASRMVQGVPTQPETTQPTVAPGQAVPSTNKGNVLDIRERLQDFLSKQSGGADNLQKLADLYKEQLAKAGERPNMSGSNALVDHYYGTNLSKVYGKPPTPAEQTKANMEAEEAVNKSRQPVTSDLLKEYGQDTNAVTKAQVAYINEKKRELSNIDTGITDDNGSPIILKKEQQPVAAKMHDAMFLGRGSNSQVQQSIGKLRSASQFENLVAAIPEGKPNPQEMADLSTALGQTVNGTNVLTDHRFTSLYPSSMALTADNVVQWLTSKPSGVEQTQWINRMLNEIGAEKAGAQKVANHWVDAQEQYYKSAGLHPKFVHAAAQSAKNFYNNAYEPVAGVGKFSATGPGGQVKPSNGRGTNTQPKTVRQRGNTYILNEATGKYE